MLETLAHRYPEKTLYLGQVFNDTTNSYKLVWFLAILSLIRRGADESFDLADVFTEMAVAAWHPVCLYRLSLGRQDKLQDAVRDFRTESGLLPNARPEDIREWVQNTEDAQVRLDYFKRYVLTRFLVPWFTDELRGLEDTRKSKRIEMLSRESQKGPVASLYWIDRGVIRLNPSWRLFLAENMALVRGFTEHHFALYLQARNPNVPGIVNKLEAQSSRDLARAREFWAHVYTQFNRTGQAKEFQDIYSQRQLGTDYAIDHFLPWSFVAHDLLWNLTPVETKTNSQKGDDLPDLNIYLPRLARLHFAAVRVAAERPKLLEDYIECFKVDVPGLLAIKQDGFLRKYREILDAQAQIAANQGFYAGWQLPAPEVVLVPGLSVTPDLSRMRGRTWGGDLATIVLPADREQPSKDFLPYFSLAIAAGAFVGGDAPAPEGWINVRELGYSRRISEGMFVTRVVGKSMEPTIRDNSLCVFRYPVEGTRQQRVLLIQKRNFTDPETGGNYTVKRYRSTKSKGDDGWQHETIELVPDNPDREKFHVLKFTPEDETDLRAIAEFVQELNFPAKGQSTGP
jgi:hypothetical protein